MAIGRAILADRRTGICAFRRHAAIPAQAQDFPARPVRVIVPFAPGGGVDIVARLIAPKLSEAWGQPVVIENKPGAVGAVASEYVMHQPADGYTVLIGVAGSHAIAQYLNPNLGYDPVRDFAGVTVLSYSPLICLVAPSSPFHTMKELVDYAKTQAGAVRQSRRRLADASDRRNVQSQYGTQFQHVAYRGVAPAMQDLLGGHIPMVMGEMGSSKPLVTSGQLRALAVTGAKRNPSVPDVPTFTEAGYPGFEVNSWFALFVPAATPKPIIDKIAADVTKVVRRPEISARLARRRLGARRRHAGRIHEAVAGDGQATRPVIQERHITIE